VDPDVGGQGKKKDTVAGERRGGPKKKRKEPSEATSIPEKVLLL